MNVGMICPEAGGHLNPFMALAAELRRRGHRVTFYLRPLGAEKVRVAGFDCRVYGKRDHAAEPSRARLRAMGRMRGFAALTYTVGRLRRMMAAALAEVPRLAREDKIDVVICDEAVITIGSTVAEAVRQPYVVVSTALLMYVEPETPPFWTLWAYRTERWAILRNRVANRFFHMHVRRGESSLIQCRRRLGLPNSSSISPLVRICHQPPGFDFPRRAWPENLHWTGPLTDASARAPIDFPFERLDGRPMIYAVLGSILGQNRAMFQCIAAACAGLPVQLVISLGGSATAAEVGNLPGAPLVVDFAPQLELLKRAALCINHAGMNTVTECLAQGVPIVALPVMNDGLGTARRIVWTSCGEMLRPSEIRPAQLRTVIKQVLNNSRYREAAERFRDACRDAGGLKRAADVIENAFANRAGSTAG
jgi:MGT family glycosyltransferase